MERASLELGRIARNMRLRFNIIINLEENKNDKSLNTISKTTSFGNTFIKVAPNPYITIDISKDRNDTSNPNMSVNINRLGVFELSRVLIKMLRRFENKELFYIQNKRLVVNKRLSEDYSEVCSLNGKHVHLRHVVIIDEQNPEIDYEGICFSINSIDNYCMLTHTELEFLIHEIRKADMSTLSLLLLDLYIKVKNNKSIQTRDFSISEVKNEERASITPEIKKTMPEI